MSSHGNCYTPGCKQGGPNFKHLPEGAIQPRKSMEFPKANPSVDRIVALTECNGILYLATERHIYRKDGDRWIPMEIERPEEDPTDNPDWWKD